MRYGYDGGIMEIDVGDGEEFRTEKLQYKLA